MSLPDAPQTTPVGAEEPTSAEGDRRTPPPPAVDDISSTRRVNALPTPPPVAGRDDTRDTDALPAGTPRPDASGGFRRALRGIDTIDNYRILDELGHGGMAVVYRAEDTRLHRQVALKILHDHIASREENRERFVREARAAARLRHPNIIDIYGFSSPAAPVQYIAAELIDGRTLRQVVEDGISLPEIGVLICLQVARALAAAHADGIIHRDVKPENVMLSRAGVTKLMDFGLARLLDAQTLTMTGAVLGSPAHMAPESIEGAPADMRVDVFAFGTVLYFATVGALPFDGRNPAMVLNAVLQGRYEPPQRANPLVSRRVARVIERCLARDPAERYANAGELVGELERALADVGITQPDAELGRFIQAPDEASDSLRQRVVDATLARARRDAAAGRVAAAMSACDRVLALDPENAEAMRIVSRVRQRERRRLASRLVVALLVLVGIGTSLAWWDSTRPPAEAMLTLDAPELDPPVRPAPPPPQIDDVIAMAVGHAASALEAAGSAGDGANHAVATAERARSVADAWRPPRGVVPLPARPPVLEAPIAIAPADAGGADAAVEPPPEVAAAALHPVTLRIHPLSASVRIDGRPMGNAAELRQGVALAPGLHRIELFVSGLSDGRLEETFEVVPGATNQFAFRVPWPDAFVIVESERAGNVVVDGRVGATNERVPVAFAGLENRRTIEVVVLPPDGAPYEEQVDVRTEQTVRLSAPF